MAAFRVSSFLIEVGIGFRIIFFIVHNDFLRNILVN